MLTDYQRYRLYEMLPGLSIWGTLFLVILLSFVKPLWMIYFIIVFDIYWVLKVFNFSFYLIIAWIRFRQTRSIDWKDKIKYELTNHEDKWHIIFLTLYNEEWDVVETAIESIVSSVYNKDKFIIVVAGEERKEDHYHDILGRIKNKFFGSFHDIVGVCHPSNLPDEIHGKGSNLNYAEQEMKKYIDERSWDYDKLIVTIFDIDTVCHAQYFAYLTYLYCTHPNPTKSSYQPIAVYNNNMWESPAILRVMAFGTTFWMLTSLARQDALVTFSSHSMSFRAIVDAGFHEKRIVSEDSRIFYQCLLTYNGNYEVTPMYLPVSMDTVRDDKWKQSIKNLYRQQRRWAWGVEHVPYLLWEFRKKGKAIPLWKKFKWVFVEWEGKWSWCLIALLITVLGQLPLLVAPESIRQSALFFNAPHMLQIIMTSAMLGMALSAILSLPLLPPRPESHPRHKYVIMILQWALLPISLIFISAIPAIDAVTHMMCGKYLGFNVSQKKRLKN
ncbi:MAG: hypothetical protein COX81_01950 [Candidatus Magasanikbacteria bacterium CG_4_10_14_0_2_um_filter_37_12]|uniref:Glycosyltransferase 2-like domain-containing protein n=1 Tax=Candidatus Magasanikbacteria bacterium CG_4_10_14_0_2_um_filter_37_12 TaxID=1974637 RepID=A0A2M7V8C7_9BACT|nr:MAG: hypothetical protein COX81_01950 [Candidatus Magasanikbacteria bacterium CG_4_10_14_0_2_um_filter_37_12]